MEVLQCSLGIILVFLCQCYSSPVCTEDADNLRFDCYPEPGASEEKCESRGCCWKVAENSRHAASLGDETVTVPLDVPYCFYPRNFGYQLVKQQETATGYLIELQMQQKGPFGGDITSLKVDIRLETENRVHVKVCTFN